MADGPGGLLARWPVVALVLALLMGVAYYRTSARTAPEQAFWVRDYPAALERAAAENKRVFMDVYGDWCGPCKKMDRDTFTDARVHAALDDFVALKVNADQQEAVVRRYNVEFLPSLFVLDASGQPVAQAAGYHGPRELVEFLERAGGGR